MKDNEALSFSNLLTDAEFDRLREFFTRATGNKLGLDKRSLVEGRLRKYILSTEGGAKGYLDNIQNNPLVQSEFISALTTHKTDWFRESPHFDFLKRQISEKLPTQSDWKIWSAACSTGEEVYSLLMTLIELNVPFPKILGTDISEKCVQAGKSGIFNQQIVDSQVPAHLKQKYFLRSISSQNSKSYKFDPQYSALTKWKIHNLIESDLGSPVLFDFIFIRNVLIYFDMPTGQKVVSRLMRHLKPGGFLIIGLSETIQDIKSLHLQRVENSVFRKDRA